MFKDGIEAEIHASPRSGGLHRLTSNDLKIVILLDMPREHPKMAMKELFGQAMFKQMFRYLTMRISYREEVCAVEQKPVGESPHSFPLSLPTGKVRLRRAQRHIHLPCLYIMWF